MQVYAFNERRYIFLAEILSSTLRKVGNEDGLHRGKRYVVRVGKTP